MLLLFLLLVSADPILTIPSGLKSPLLLPSVAPLAIDEDAKGSGPSLQDALESVRYPVDGDEWLQDPFLVLDGEMNTSAIDLSDGDVTRSAGRTQPRIISRLDRLVTLLEKKCKGGGAAGMRATEPAGDSSLSAGPGGVGDLVDKDGPARGMDRLSDAERAKILQAQAAGFPPGFENVLTDYYRRLATEQPATVDGQTTTEDVE